MTSVAGGASRVWPTSESVVDTIVCAGPGGGVHEHRRAVAAETGLPELAGDGGLVGSPGQHDQAGRRVGQRRPLHRRTGR